MRFNAGFGAAAIAAMLLSPSALAQGYGVGGGFGGAPQTIGIGGYTPGNGPVGVQGFTGQSYPGSGGFIGGGWGGSYYPNSGSDNYIVPGGNASVNNVIYYDARPRDGGFYGGGGVFYGDNGYSRVYYNHPPARYSDNYCPPAATTYRPAQHVYYLSDFRRTRRVPRY